jgi:DNA helicase HerA-like ATPase
MTSTCVDSRLDAELTERLAHYRYARRRIERSVLPVATSVDGVSFRFQASLDGLQLRRGGYVMLEDGDALRLGQVIDLGVDSAEAAAQGLRGSISQILIRLAAGTGLILDGDGRPFHDATVRPADPGEVGAWCARMRPERAALTIGELLLAPGVRATLDSRGLGRHTFMCGQSGSGKTYSLGVLLEQVLAETSLRVVILDPNSDYVRLGIIDEQADPASRARYAAVPGDVAVWRNGPSSEHQLRLRFADLSPAAQAAVLGLDPVRDRDEYAVLADLLRHQKPGRSLVDGAEQLLPADLPSDARNLRLRAANLGVSGWRIWSPTSPSLAEELRNPTARCTVVDLGSLDTAQEQRVVAQAVLSTLWESRLSRQPCLIVIDEAHNICPADPRDELTRLTSEQSVQIAAEGRKYGLYELISTQRPNKVQENVVSQCDNLLLMRLNSHADLAYLGRLLSFVPEGLMAGAMSLRMGQALVAGRFLSHAAYVRIGKRVSREGGADVPAAWAAAAH